MANLGEYAERARQERAEVVKKEEDPSGAKRDEMVKHRVKIRAQSKLSRADRLSAGRPASSANMPVISGLANKV
jgi:hypothetical protein